MYFKSDYVLQRKIYLYKEFYIWIVGVVWFFLLLVSDVTL